MRTNWSISLEHDDYEMDAALVVADAIQAVQDTAAGYYVNLVTPSLFGNPEDYLKEPLELCFGRSITSAFISQCGCGGYVYRVWKTDRAN